MGGSMRRSIAVLFFIIICLPMTLLAERIVGDVNNDNRIDIFDVLALLKFISGDQAELYDIGKVASDSLIVDRDTVYITDPDTVSVDNYLLYNDIYGVVEFELDETYPPPFSLDNLSDDNIVVTLYFGESIDFYRENDVYGYFISYDDNTEQSNAENFSFPFVPSGQYWLDAEFTIADSCYYVKTSKFFHTDSAHTFQELRPVFLGTGQNCWSVGLASAGDMVKISDNFWVNRSVYNHVFKNRVEDMIKSIRTHVED
jgi:hypothetical protein